MLYHFHPGRSHVEDQLEYVHLLLARVDLLDHGHESDEQAGPADAVVAVDDASTFALVHVGLHDLTEVYDGFGIFRVDIIWPGGVVELVEGVPMRIVLREEL